MSYCKGCTTSHHHFYLFFNLWGFFLTCVFSFLPIIVHCYESLNVAVVCTLFPSRSLRLVPLQFLMVKFLCTRQDSAERLGVQSLGFSGYLCPGTERLGDLDDLAAHGESSEHGAVTGLRLLNKTLFFIQQLTQDMVTKTQTLIIK